VLDAADRFTAAPPDEVLRKQGARLEVVPLFV
jgi:hypothetical protein